MLAPPRLTAALQFTLLHTIMSYTAGESFLSGLPGLSCMIGTVIVAAGAAAHNSRPTATRGIHMDAISHVDTLVGEYLMFRGFTEVRYIAGCSAHIADRRAQSLRALEADRQRDPLQGFSVDAVVDLLMGYADT